MEEYRIPSQDAEAEFVEKHSRFITHIWHTQTEEEALLVIVNPSDNPMRIPLPPRFAHAQVLLGGEIQEGVCVVPPLSPALIRGGAAKGWPHKQGKANKSGAFGGFSRRGHS